MNEIKNKTIKFEFNYLRKILNKNKKTSKCLN